MNNQNTLMNVRTNILRAIAFAWDNPDETESFYGAEGVKKLLQRAKDKKFNLVSLEPMETVDIQFMKPSERCKYNREKKGYAKDWDKAPNQEIITICLPSCEKNSEGKEWSSLEKAEKLMKYYEISPHFFHEASFANNSSININALQTPIINAKLNFALSHRLGREIQLLKQLHLNKAGNQALNNLGTPANELINENFPDLEIDENYMTNKEIRDRFNQLDSKDKLGVGQDGFLSFGSVVLQLIAEAWSNADFKEKLDFDSQPNKSDPDKYDAYILSLLKDGFEFEALWDMKLRFVFTKEEGSYNDGIDRSPFDLTSDSTGIGGVRTLIQVILPPRPENEADLLPALAAYNCIGPRYPFTCS